MKLIPGVERAVDDADALVVILVAQSPNIIAPRHSLLAETPVRPSDRCSMVHGYSFVQTARLVPASLHHSGQAHLGESAQLVSKASRNPTSETPAAGAARRRRVSRNPRRRARHADELTVRQVKLNLGGSVHDPTNPLGRLLFDVLAMVAEFTADLIWIRTREGIKVARARGRLQGKQPKLSTRQEAHLVALHKAGTHTSGELAELFSVARSSVYRAIQRAAH